MLNKQRINFSRRILSTFAAVLIAALTGPEGARLYAQTCSCAGAPLISSQSLGTAGEGELLLGFTQEYNEISDLYSGDRELQNRSQERHTLTSLLEVNYGITERLSLSATFTFISKSRTTGLQNPEFTETMTTNGPGDGLFMIKYNMIRQTLWKPYQLSAGGGVKVPVGVTGLKNNGLALNADMQPGTGAWDGVGWLFGSYTFRQWNLNVYSVNSFRITGSHERFNANDRYRFGNELVSSAGVSGVLTDPVSFNVLLKYRTTSPDRRNNNEMPSTGGQWLSIKPGLSWQPGDRFNVQVAGELPLYRTLNGTQPTTSYVLSASLFYTFGVKSSAFIYGR